MAGNFWRSTHGNSWLLQQDLVDAQDEQHAIFNRQEAQRVRLDCVENIQKLGKSFQLRQRVASTAVVFFKRFFVKASMADFDPRLVAVTTLFIASKADECGIAASEFVPEAAALPGFTFRYSTAAVLECEFYVLDTLTFDLQVYHPYRPLTQYVADAGMPDILQAAWEIVNDSYRSDLCLVYPPYLIAVAAIYVACGFHDRNCNPWLKQINVKRGEVLEVVQVLLGLYDGYDASKRAKPTMEELHRRLDDHFAHPGKT